MSQSRQTALLAREADLSQAIKDHEESKKALQEKEIILSGILRTMGKHLAETRHSQTLLENLHSEVYWLRTGQRIKSNDGGQLLVGTMNSLPGDLPFSQYISDIHVNSGGSGVIGVLNGKFDINKFFK